MYIFSYGITLGNKIGLVYCFQCAATIIYGLKKSKSHLHRKYYGINEQFGINAEYWVSATELS